MNTRNFHLSTTCLVTGLAALVLMTSCSNQSTYIQRTPAPGGGYYVQRTVRPKSDSNAGPFGFLSGWKKNASQDNKPAVMDDSGWWKGDVVSGKPSLTINLTEQKVFYYKGGNLVGMAPISSGREGNETVAGQFKIIEKDIDHRSSLYGDYVGPDGEVLKREIDVRKDPVPSGGKFDGAEMNYFMRITGAIGMHEGYLPGYPASHGCIRMPKRMAKIFFEETPMGTPVKIVK